MVTCPKGKTGSPVHGSGTGKAVDAAAWELPWSVTSRSTVLTVPGSTGKLLLVSRRDEISALAERARVILRTRRRSCGDVRLRRRCVWL